MNVERVGEGPPFVLLHGFTGSAEGWRAHLDVFGEHFTSYAVDLIGHGKTESPHVAERYGMERCVEDLLVLFDRLEIEQMALLGYSMGGRSALQLAVAAPERISALVLESASPGIPDAAELAARVKSDEALAQSIERDGLEAFIDYWEGLPLFASQRNLPPDVWQRHRMQRLNNDPVGLANSLRGMGAGAMQPVWERLDALTMPTLLMVGELDEKYVKQGREMAEPMPNASLTVVPKVGHAVHLEAPETFDRIISTWLTKQVGR
ncbi:MAG: 2-succinyl-6-hydroxy-2,4-cyclohexadiene-1-carboxylate synthase [Nitrolancea sp.]